MVEDNFLRMFEDGKSARSAFGLPDDASNDELIDVVLRRAMFKNEKTGEDLEPWEAVNSLLKMKDIVCETHDKIIKSPADAQLRTAMLESWLQIASRFEIILKEYNDTISSRQMESR